MEHEDYSLQTLKAEELKYLQTPMQGAPRVFH